MTAGFLSSNGWHSKPETVVLASVCNKILHIFLEYRFIYAVLFCIQYLKTDGTLNLEPTIYYGGVDYGNAIHPLAAAVLPPRLF